jgi:hypothetical protein
MTIKNPFKYFKTSPEIIRLAVMYYVRYLAAEPSVFFPPKLKVLLYCSEGLLPAHSYQSQTKTLSPAIRL